MMEVRQHLRGRRQEGDGGKFLKFPTVISKSRCLCLDGKLAVYNAGYLKYRGIINACIACISTCIVIVIVIARRLLH